MAQMRILGVLAVVVWASGCRTQWPGIPETSDPEPGPEFRLAYSNPGGMWLPQQMALPVHVETLRKLGVRFDAKALANPYAMPLGAVVSLGGCTGAFVSPTGLILTNYHCVQEALQVISSQSQQDLMVDGFLARDQDAEKPVGPGHHAFVTAGYRDVTAQVRDSLDKIADPVARSLRLERNLKALYRACERPFVRCYIRPYFGGAVYIQTETLEIRDIRLVYAPARAIGAYGGEADNWKWPRHSGDWALYRAYARRDGTPDPYARNNVAFRPRNVLRISTDGVKAGDFVMIAGYPGSTQRTATAGTIDNWIKWWLPHQIAWDKERYEIAERFSGEVGDTGVKARLAHQTIQNDLAHYEATLAGLTAGNAMAKKRAIEDRIRQWVAQPGHETHRLALDKLDRLDAEYARTARADLVRSTVLGASQLLTTARYLVRWAEQRTRPDDERKLGFQDSYLGDALEAQRRMRWTFDRALDRQVLSRALIDALQLPDAERPWLATLLGIERGAPIDDAMVARILNDWYRVETIEDEAVRDGWLRTATLAQLQSSTDPFIRATLRIWSLIEADDNRAHARLGTTALYLEWYVDAMEHAVGEPLAPDANGSLRISYGTVKSQRPASSDPADRPFTVASQILARNTGLEPFNAPSRLLAAIRAGSFGPYADSALGGELPVDFLADLDAAGGNSGSPVLDRNGRLVGVMFDTASAGGAADVVFDPTSRVIAADVRYLAWTMDLLDGGDKLLEEMGIIPMLPDGSEDTSDPAERAPHR
jgi:hypothetical protein